MGSTRLSLGESGGDLVELGDRAMGWVASAADSRYMESGSRVSKCHRLTVVRRRKISLTLCNILKFVCAKWKIHDFIHFLNLFVPFYPLYEHVHRFFDHFPAQIF